jgi:hypothetical protein
VRTLLASRRLVAMQWGRAIARRILAPGSHRRRAGGAPLEAIRCVLPDAMP